MILPWLPIRIIDIAGASLTLVMALWSLWLSRQWSRDKKEDDFRHYVFLLATAIGIFAVSRSVGHILKQYLLLTGQKQVWQDISPYSGAINTAIFVVIFAFSIYFHHIRAIHLELENYKQHLENLVKERTSELQHQLRFQQELIDSVPAPIFFKDHNGVFLGGNTAFASLLNLAPGDLPGKTIYDLAPVDLADRYDAIDRMLIARGGIDSYEGLFRNGDNEMREVIFYKATFTDRNGDIAGIIGTIFDVTERKILEKQLQQTQKMEAIGTLAGGIAHDFNNILMAIIGFTDLAMANTEPGSATMEHLEEVKSASLRAKDLVKQILSFSRRDEQEVSPVRLGPIIKEVCKLIRAMLPTTIEIKQEIAPVTGLVMANTTQIHQVMMNLFSNANHSMRDQGGTITVTLDEVDIDQQTAEAIPDLQPRRYLRITVDDTGCGMKKEVLNRLFDPFFTTKRIGEGTGLGLSVVHGIIKSHQGAIQVESEPGKGTTFTIFLPLVTEAARPEKKDAAEAPTGTERILFVDDEKPLVNMTREILEGLGYTIDGRTDSQEALAAFAAHPDQYDLVITDQTMPNMTGIEMTEQLLKIRPDIPVILCTGFSETVSAERADATGVRAFVMKPIVSRDLAAIIRKVLDNPEAEFVSA